MLILPRNIQAPCLLRRGMLTIFLHLGIFQPAKWGIFNRRKLGNIQPALTVLDTVQPTPALRPQAAEDPSESLAAKW